jgi:hypothetical protein
MVLSQAVIYCDSLDLDFVFPHSRIAFRKIREIYFGYFFLSFLFPLKHTNEFYVLFKKEKNLTNKKCYAFIRYSFYDKKFPILNRAPLVVKREVGRLALVNCYSRGPTAPPGKFAAEHGIVRRASRCKRRSTLKFPFHKRFTPVQYCFNHYVSSVKIYQFLHSQVSCRHFLNTFSH